MLLALLYWHTLLLKLPPLWVVRCFIGAIFGHSQVPGPLRGLEIPANEFSLCDSSLEQGLTLLTQLVKLLDPLSRRLYRQLLG